MKIGVVAAIDIDGTEFTQRLRGLGFDAHDIAAYREEARYFKGGQVAGFVEKKKPGLLVFVLGTFEDVDEAEDALIDDIDQLDDEKELKGFLEATADLRHCLDLGSIFMKGSCCGNQSGLPVVLVWPPDHTSYRGSILTTCSDDELRAVIAEYE